MGSREYETNRPMDAVPLVGTHPNTPKISFKGLRTFVSRSKIRKWLWEVAGKIRGEILCPGPVSIVILTCRGPR